MNNIRKTLLRIPSPEVFAHIFLGAAAVLASAVLFNSWDDFGSLNASDKFQAVLKPILFLVIMVNIVAGNRGFVYFMAILSCALQPVTNGYQFMVLYEDYGSKMDAMHVVLYSGSLLAALAAFPFCLGYFYQTEPSVDA